MASKSPQAFRTIREVADWLGIEAHVLRFWESKFTQIKPVKRAGGRRYYRPADMRLVGGVKVLLHDQGLTIRGVQKMIREDGVPHVSALSPALDEDLADGNVIEAIATIAVVETPPAIETEGVFDLAAPVEAQAPVEVVSAPPVDDTAETVTASEETTAPTPVDNVTRDMEEVASSRPSEPIEQLDTATKPSPAPIADTDTPATPADTLEIEPLSALHALVTDLRPLDAQQVADIAPHVARLQALADRLSSKSKSA